MISSVSVDAIIIQARMGSLRFPGKMMSELAGMPLIGYVYKRCSQSSIEKVLVATSRDSSDNILYEYCTENAIPVFRGEFDDVLKRYIQAAELSNTKNIIRISGDTPLVDIFLMETLLNRLKDEKLDYIAPDRKNCAGGFFSEAINLKALKRSFSFTDDTEDLEHVTKYILENADDFMIKTIDPRLNPEFIHNIRLTIDYPEDIKVVNEILKRLPNKFIFTSVDILNIIAEEKNGIACVG